MFLGRFRSNRLDEQLNKVEKKSKYIGSSHNAIVEETFHIERLEKTFKFGLQNAL
jgi:hypothetical protein